MREMDETFRTEVEAAIRAAHGAEKYLLSNSIEEITEHWQRVIPDGCRVFLAVAESVTCHHDPRCQWTYLLFLTKEGYSVLLDVLKQMPYLSIAELHQRLVEKQN